MGEIAIEKIACQKIKVGLGVLSLKLNVRANNGWPDRLFWIPGGRPFMIEFKAPGEVPDPLQRHIHEKLRSLGYEVEVHDSVAGAYGAVQSALARARSLDPRLGPEEGG